MRRLQLKTRVGQFFDPETGLRLRGSQTVPLPNTLGHLTRTWVNAGGLVIIESQAEPAQLPVGPPQTVETLDPPMPEGTPDPLLVDDTPDPAPKPVDRVAELMGAFNRDTLWAMAKEKGIKVKGRMSAQSLAEKIAKSEL